MVFGVICLAFLASFAHPADAHGYLTHPISRRLNEKKSKYTSITAFGAGQHITNCGREGLSMHSSHDAVTDVQRGTVMKFDIVIDAHHAGHLEMRLCPFIIDGDDQDLSSCTLLQRASSVEAGVNDCTMSDDRDICAAVDPNNPGWWYLAPKRTQGQIHSMWFHIPSDVNCPNDRCTVQFTWKTANSCNPHPASYCNYYHNVVGPQNTWCKNWYCGGFCGSNSNSVENCEATMGNRLCCSEVFTNCAEVKLIGERGPAPSGSPTLPSPTLQPTPAPSAIPPSVSKPGKELVAFVENWLPCPSIEQIERYTKVVVSFAVSYTWKADKNDCSPICQIGTPSICANSPQPGLIGSWQAVGTKVLLSFGGAGMGGSWAGDVNDCWEACFGHVDAVVSQLTDIVNAQNFDGVDIDYEYFHTSKSAAFLKDLTLGLRQSLGSTKIISHAPMDGDIEKGKPYFEVLKEVAFSLDYVLPQYYNGPFRPAQNLAEPLDHMGDLIRDIFYGDQSKVIFGFCISDCSGTGSNVNSEQAVSIVKGVSSKYPDHGGAFLWAASADNGWSGPVAEALAIAGSSPGQAPTTNSPTPVATTAPLPNPVHGNSCAGEPCGDVSYCRSKWGYCGPGSDYCNAESTWSSNGCTGATPSTVTSAPLPTAAPVEPETHPEIEPESEPEPELESVSCVPIGNCGQEDWCDQDAYNAWCHSFSQGDVCPIPFCTPNVLAAMVQLPARRLKISRHHRNQVEDTLLFQRGTKTSSNEKSKDSGDVRSLRNMARVDL